jgi:hypothetical protein
VSARRRRELDRSDLPRETKRVPERPTGTVTFLFSDIEGSTRLLRQLRDKYDAVLSRHAEIMRAAFAEHDGHEIDTQGDAFFAAFMYRCGTQRERDEIGGILARVGTQKCPADGDSPHRRRCAADGGRRTATPTPAGCGTRRPRSDLRVGPPETCEEVEAERVDLAGHALIPDLHNCHLHSGLLRGTAEDLPMLDWLRRMRITRWVPVKSIGLRNCC